jgi:hypothetical protein
MVHYRENCLIRHGEFCNLLSSILKNSTGRMELSFKDKRNVFITDEVLYGYLTANKWMNNA